MDPRIQFTRTTDGVSIAYWALGDGPVVVSSSMPTSHIGREWQIPAFRAMYELGAQQWRFVRYDPRGHGLSEREIEDFSLDALVRDLEAVVDRLGVARMRLTAFGIAAPVGLAYAARHPDRVSHLVVGNGFDRGSDATTPRLAALSQLAATDWVFASEGILRAFVGWENDDEARAAAAFLRESIDGRRLIALTDQLLAWDVTSELPRITAKTLVLHNRENPAASPRIARRMAATIPHSELVLLDGPVAPFVTGDALVAIARFLSDAPGPISLPPAPPPLRHHTAVILFADIVGSTELTEELGDLHFHERARALDASLRRIVAARGGEAIDGKLLGDGVLVLFAAARDAVAAALECAALGDAAGLPLHLGIHAGDVIREAGNVHGGAVNVAARISAMAEQGEVLVSEVVRALGRTSTDVEFDDRGEHRLKGVAEPQRLFRVRPPPRTAA
jgi:class 3 adenylate cyclase/pimeloyl-ACP methyl ester carboxylesterase